MLFPTSLVGSYPQPDWLVRREKLGVPRVRTTDLWRIDEAHLEEAQDDATRLAVRAQVEAGLDIVTDGEIRRESYSNRFATSLGGIDPDRPGSAPVRTSTEVMTTVPRVVGPLRRERPVQVRDAELLRSLTDRTVKMTIPGPFTMSQQAQDDYYGDERQLALAYAKVVREEAEDLFSAGVDIVQFDEPYMDARVEKARAFGVEALEAAISGLPGTTAVHICFGYAAFVRSKAGAYSFLTELADTSVDQISIEAAQSQLDCSVLSRLGDKTVILGVLDLSTPDADAADVVESRVERALEHVPAERIVLAPDCGMKFLSQESAFGKLQAMVAAASSLRAKRAA